MHGMFEHKTTAYNTAFDTFIGTLYDNGTLPPVCVVDDIFGSVREYYKRTGKVLVLSENEDAECPVFGNWGTYYAFEGWLNYRAMSGNGNEFQLMVADVLQSAAWSSDTKRWVDILHGLVVVQEEYAAKFGHYPANLNKFIKSYVVYGEDTVLLCDRY